MKKVNHFVKVSAKILIILMGTLFVLFVCLFFISNEKLPEGEQSEEADQLAKKMLSAVHHDAYNQTDYLEWSFAGKQHYKWNKKEGLVSVSWEKNRVILNLKNPDSSTVMVNELKLKGDAKFELIQQATAHFNNDSFWLIAPHKVFDPGTERRLITLKSGEEALLVSYTSGGNTPGDSYLWMLNEAGLPTAFKMWVSILPIGGLKASWESWKKTESGILLPANHHFLFFDLKMENIKAWNQPDKNTKTLN